MKRVLKSSAVVVMVLFLSAGLAFAGSGNGAVNGTGEGVCNGTGPIHDVLAGEPFDITGEVVSLADGQGMVIATEIENITVYGIGPAWYWDAVGVDRPAVGEIVRVIGYIVDYNDVERYIVMTIWVGETEVQLRDAETGLPLWRGGKGATLATN